MLNERKNIVWGKAIKLFNGKDLTGWEQDGKKQQWLVKDGELTSPESGSNLITKKFRDFKLHIEFKLKPKSNLAACICQEDMKRKLSIILKVLIEQSLVWWYLWFPGAQRNAGPGTR